MKTEMKKREQKRKKGILFQKIKTMYKGKKNTSHIYKKKTLKII